VEEARLLLDAGFDGLILENYGDAPFFPDRVPPVTVACMTRVAATVRELGRFPLGINVLRNDAAAALSVAVACGADFIRVNVHTGVAATDQGWIQGRAHETLRLRRALATRVQIWADLLCKHAYALHPLDLVGAGRDAVERGGADAVLLTGDRTGEAPSPEDLSELLDLRLGVPVLVASGVTPENLDLYRGASGFIVGSWIRRGGRAGAPLEARRVRQMAEAWKRWRRDT
jgi:hypothetical protein